MIFRLVGDIPPTRALSQSQLSLFQSHTWRFPPETSQAPASVRDIDIDEQENYGSKEIIA